MGKKVVHGILVALLFVLALIGGYFFGQRQSLKNPLLRSVTPMDKLKATLQMIDESYVDSVDVDALVTQLIPTLISQLDPHSTYLTAEERAAEQENLDGFFYGVGISFNTILDTAVVIQTVPNGPSDIAGLKPGDRIVTIDGKNTTGNTFSPDSIRSLLKGKKGSIVTLGVRPYNTSEITEVQVKRGVVNTSNVDATFMVNDSLGFVRLKGFSVSTHDDFMQSVAKLRNSGAKGLILDLRDNPGGLVQPALLIANEMLPEGSLIIYTEGAHKKRSDVYSDGTGTLIGFPIYVLLNELSASSSEIVSGALQDNDIAVLIGRRSFGKGLMQKPFEYYDGSSVHLTIARYHTASGRSIQRDYKLGGDEAYTHDWIDRVMGGEMFSADSVKLNPNLLYKTKAGRSVHGGGGIMPDIFVPRDTLGMTSYYAEVLNKGLVHEFSFVYADKYRNLLSRIGSLEEVYRFLDNQGLVWQLAKYAQKKGVVPRNYQIAQSQKQLNSILFPLVVDYLYGQDSSWKVRSLDDPMIKRAELLFSQRVYSPLAIPKEVKNVPDSLLIAQ
ncbi:S41 family peptidase [Porphyromonas levii]|uniref:S41 family peptidase n=1 Tax=Porphyromonas levii TaxID=28114 RepID=A0A4Y8WRN6_9PORP|nr:S41 family peptidase [Porphyromonas levii]TFH96144.1 S41 family peptidase [Porphyromonas levii]TFH97254.1 S41 family peptidase [Porphyromonas levii]